MSEFRQALLQFFGLADQVFAGEKTYHALLYHALLSSGFRQESIAREVRLSAGPVDLALYPADASGDFTRTREDAVCVIEMKGGAYGTRNALNDHARPSRGLPKDVSKLRAEVDAGREAWFVCLDLMDPNRALSDEEALELSCMVTSRGVNFAYSAQSFGRVLLRGPSSEPEYVAIDDPRLPGVKLDVVELLTHRSPFRLAFAEMAGRVRGSEDNYVAALYHLLMEFGASPGQLSRETYFGFAKRKGSRMHLRPDLTVYTPGVAGRFNLYRAGDTSQSNDAVKLETINAVVEVKGGSGMRKSDRGVSTAYEADIQKLANWRSMIEEERHARSLVVPTSDVTYLKFSVDRRPKPLALEARRALAEFAVAVGVRFIYEHVP